MHHSLLTYNEILVINVAIETGFAFRTELYIVRRLRFVGYLLRCIPEYDQYNQVCYRGTPEYILRY